MRFVGIDLAWKATNSTGVAVVDEDGAVIDEQWATTDEEIAQLVSSHDALGAVVAIDAPLVLTPGAPGPRPCERHLQRCYGGRHAGPYSSSIERLGGTRAMDLVKSFASSYATTAVEPRRGIEHWVIEVFPHPTILELGGFDHALKYKKGRVAFRQAGLRQLYEFLLTLADGDPPLRLRQGGSLQALHARLDQLRGAELKRFEDLADAHVCALTALWWWTHGLRGVMVAGDPETGEIVVARRPVETAVTTG